MEEFVFLIRIIYPFGELNIMGIYTDEKMLIKEDVRIAIPPRQMEIGLQDGKIITIGSEDKDELLYQ